MTTWSKSYHQEINATTHAIWAVLSDTSTWKQWNAGVKSIELQGDFASGSTFVMEFPDGSNIKSTLISVVAGEHFTDESKLGETSIRVEHRIQALSKDNSRLTYTIHVQGVEPEGLGEAISADFPAVMNGLANYLAQHPKC